MMIEHSQILFPPLQHLNLPPGDHYPFTWSTVLRQEGHVQIIYISTLPAAAEAECFIREEALMREQAAHSTSAIKRGHFILYVLHG